MVVWCVLASLACIGAMGWLAVLKSDVRQLSRNMEKLAPTGTRAHLTTTSFDADITRLIEHINQMLDRHREAVNEATGSEAALKAAMTNLSHDLRTPLTAAVGYLQMATTDQTDERATQARHLKLATARLESLRALLDGVFALTQLIEGTAAVATDRVDLAELVRASVADTYAELERRSFAITVDVPDEPVMCAGDAGAITRILSNLLSNVLAHGTGRVRICLDGTTVEIANQVADPTALDTTAMFTRFYTGDQSRSNRHTGLGLAIAQQLTQAMGGHLAAFVNDDQLVMRLQLPPPQPEPTSTPSETP